MKREHNPKDLSESSYSVMKKQSSTVQWGSVNWGSTHFFSGKGAPGCHQALFCLPCSPAYSASVAKQTRWRNRCDLKAIGCRLLLPRALLTLTFFLQTERAFQKQLGVNLVA
jgi:hypothetical protein